MKKQLVYFDFIRALLEGRELNNNPSTAIDRKPTKAELVAKKKRRNKRKLVKQARRKNRK